MTLPCHMTLLLAVVVGEGAWIFSLEWLTVSSSPAEEDDLDLLSFTNWSTVEFLYFWMLLVAILHKTFVCPVTELGFLKKDLKVSDTFWLLISTYWIALEILVPTGPVTELILLICQDPWPIRAQYYTNWPIRAHLTTSSHGAHEQIEVRSVLKHRISTKKSFPEILLTILEMKTQLQSSHCHCNI